MKKLKKCFIRLLILLSFNTIVDNNKAIAQNHSNNHYSVGINAMYLQNGSFSKTLMLGGSIYRKTSKDWLKLYAASNYFESSTLGSFGGLNSRLGFEVGTGFRLKMGEHFSSTLLTGIGYHRVYIFSQEGNVSNTNAIAAFGSLDVSYNWKRYEIGFLVGNSLGRGKVVTYYANGSVTQDVLWSQIPKLGIQFKYQF
ncbi:MAG: hypothetical protein ACFHU9_05420 [Fluviicola sp.]